MLAVYEEITVAIIAATRVPEAKLTGTILL
jgi:hypothetical protein